MHQYKAITAHLQALFSAFEPPRHEDRKYHKAFVHLGAFVAWWQTF